MNESALLAALCNGDRTKTDIEVIQEAFTQVRLECHAAMRARIAELEWTRTANGKQLDSRDQVIADKSAKITTLQATVQALEGDKAQLKDLLRIVRSDRAKLMAKSDPCEECDPSFSCWMASDLCRKKTHAALATHSEGKETP